MVKNHKMILIDKVKYQRFLTVLFPKVYCKFLETNFVARLLISNARIPISVLVIAQFNANPKYGFYRSVNLKKTIN